MYQYFPDTSKHLLTVWTRRPALLTPLDIPRHLSRHAETPLRRSETPEASPDRASDARPVSRRRPRVSLHLADVASMATRRPSDGRCRSTGCLASTPDRLASLSLGPARLDRVRGSLAQQFCSPRGAIQPRVVRVAAEFWRRVSGVGVGVGVGQRRPQVLEMSRLSRCRVSARGDPRVAPRDGHERQGRRQAHGQGHGGTHEGRRLVMGHIDAESQTGKHDMQS